jgi:hypothetical protein|tara:strand:- start:18 stop:752 length:735 start_codon:yes stop_codon:yes gene_type:complete
MSLFESLGRLAGGATNNTIDDFKATIGKRAGLAKTNKFMVVMTPPFQTFVNKDFQGLISQALSGNLGFNDLINDPRDIAVLCESCSLPGRQITTLEYEDEGYRNQVKVPYSYINEDVTFTFHLTNDYYMKKIFESWLATVINQEEHTVNYYGDIGTDVIIQQLDHRNIPVYGVKLLKAYPTAINSIALDNNAAETQKISVTMTYENYVQEGSISSMISGAKGLLDNIFTKKTKPITNFAKKIFN